MSLENINGALNILPSIVDWKVYLLKYKHTDEDSSYIGYDLHFESDKLLINTVAEFGNCFNGLISKFSEIREFDGEVIGNSITKISTDNNLINDNWIMLINQLGKSDDTVSITKLKSDAYIFVGKYLNENKKSSKIYLITKKNPVISFSKKPTFLSRDNTVKKIDNPLIQFNKTFDIMVYKNILYTINCNFESIFNIERSFKKNCFKCLDELNKENMVENFELYKEYASYGLRAKRFITYNDYNVKQLKNIAIRKEIAKNLKIPINKKTSKFILEDEKDAKIFTSIICGKTKRELFEECYCDVPSSTPITVS